MFSTQTKPTVLMNLQFNYSNYFIVVAPFFDESITFYK